MKRSALKRILAGCMTAMLIFASAFPTWAAQEGEQEAEVEEAAQEGAEGEAGEGEYIEGEVDGEGGAGEVTMSDLPSNNGRFIASAFPESLLPEGFHKSSCTYSGQKIEIARMDNDASGEVVLAYLADEDGSNGEFYLCDTNTANMTDFVQISNGVNGYIIVLDPGDVIVAPAGYKRAKLEWYGGKTVTAWLLPGADARSGDSDEKSEGESAKGIFDPVTVYAAGAGAEGGDSWWDNGGEAENAPEEEAAPEEEKADTEEKEEKSDDAGETKSAAPAAAAEDGSGVVYAPASDFFMVYAIDNTGIIGFYTYDKVQKTYQRYVSNAGGDDATTAQYKKSATIRLYIIAGLALILVILIFVLVNTLLSGRGDYGDDDYEDDDEEDDVERVRKKVAKKSDSRVAAAQEEYDQEDFYERQARRRREREAAERAEAEALKERAGRQESPAARAAERPQLERPVERQYERPARPARSAERTVERPSERPVERTAERSVERAERAEKSERPAARPAQEKRPARHTTNRSEMQSLLDIDEGSGAASSGPLVRRRPSQGGAGGAQVSQRHVANRPARRPSGGQGASGAAGRPVDPRRADKAALDEDFDFEFLDI